MATMATFFRRADLMAADKSLEREAVAADPYRLRGLPGDNLYLFSKRIDNSRLVRQSNPKMRTDCWSAIATVTVLAVMIGTAVSPRVGGVLTGYRTEKLKAENRELLQKRRILEIEEAGLLTPARLDALAVKNRLTTPAPGQEQRFQPRESALAMNVSATRGNNP